LDVTNFHSRQANGELFTKNSIFNVGSSIVIGGICFVFSSFVIVSHTNISGIHAIVTMSQENASFVFTFFNHWFVNISEIFHFLFVHLLSVIKTFSQIFIVHSYILHIHNLHKKLSNHRFAICIFRGLSELFGDCSTFSNIISSSGIIFFCSSFRSLIAIPFLAIV
jgi:hypothetical protein